MDIEKILANLTDGVGFQEDPPSLAAPYQSAEGAYLNSTFRAAELVRVWAPIRDRLEDFRPSGRSRWRQGQELVELLRLGEGLLTSVFALETGQMNSVLSAFGRLIPPQLREEIFRVPMTGDLASRTRCFRIAARVFWQCANLELITPVWIEENESTEEFDLLGDSEAGADYRHRIMEASIRDLALQTDRVTSELLRETREGADRPSALARTIESLQLRRKYLLFGLKVEYAPELRKGR